MRARVEALGQSFDPGQDVYALSTTCRQFVQPSIGETAMWPAFSAALEHVRPYALGIIRATILVENEVIDQGDLAEQLRTRPLGEQTLRYAWIESQRHEGETANYSPLERAVFEGIITRALAERDQANTAWLSAKVAEQGWPTRSKLGENASAAAWLLAQHADADPAFQLTALRLMAPLAPAGEVDPRNFAMLTDRVHLKLSGRQQYGTQWICEQGKRVPLPLAASEVATDKLRATVKLDSLESNAVRLDKLYGPCPPAA